MPLKALSCAGVILLALGLILGYIYVNLNTSGYFKIKEVLSRPPGMVDLAYLEGRNIFGVDLRREAERILRLCPSCSSVRLSRLFPDRLIADFIPRRPVALAKFYRYFALDAHGVLFEYPVPPGESGLPVITGLETKIFGPKAGKRYSQREVLTALNIIKEFKRGRFLRLCQIRRIDVSSASAVSVFVAMPPQPATAFPPVMEVKVGQEHTAEKINLLSGLLVASRDDWGKIRYIDLRFKEAVIKFNEGKS